MPAEPGTGINSACPRCGSAFHCGVNDSEPCACSSLKLDAATLRGLREQFTDCLCLNCLWQLQAKGEGDRGTPAEAGAPGLASTAQVLIDGRFEVNEAGVRGHVLERQDL